MSRLHVGSTTRLILIVGLFVAVGTIAQERGGFFSNFTGEVSIVDSDEMRSSRLRFEAGARTVWHLHDQPQLILIEEGRGRLQEQGGPVRVLEAGEPVLTRANVPHWHGADPEQAAVQFSVYSGSLEWQEPVTDDEYLGR